MSQTVRVVMVEGNAQIRAGMLLALDAAGVAVLAAADDPLATLELIPYHRPDVLIMDLDLPGTAGLRTCRLLAQEGLGIGILGTTVRPEDTSLMKAALEAGVRGFLSKTTNVRELSYAVKTVDSGSVVVGAAAADRLWASLVTPSTPAGLDAFPTLTRREREVLDLVARGCDNRHIARSLVLADKTVRNHVSAVLVKLGARNRAQAIVRARAAGMGLSGEPRGSRRAVAERERCGEPAFGGPHRPDVRTSPHGSGIVPAVNRSRGRS